MLLQTYDTQCSNWPVGARKPIPLQDRQLLLPKHVSTNQGAANP
jgi:hypothetical protein